jgi:FkbM family methyltransferase
MFYVLARFVNRILSKIGLHVTSAANSRRMLNYYDAGAALARAQEIWTSYPYDAGQFLQHLSKSKSQLQQDLLAVAVSGAKRNGYFVEFGATNGVDLSNTYLLEQELEWTGILAEPGKNWHRELMRNRKSSVVEKAVWTQSGKTLDFLEVFSSPELSTLSSFKKSDHHARKGKSYKVETISLLDLLASNNAPHFIDFISIDTEGSELPILESFDFSRYSFGLMCIEHNYKTDRELISKLLESKGYVRILSTISEFDDWFVPTSL